MVALYGKEKQGIRILKTTEDSLIMENPFMKNEDGKLLLMKYVKKVKVQIGNDSD